MIMPETLELEAWAAQRDKALDQVQRNAGEIFRSRARGFVLAYLRHHGPSAGEEVTDACKLAGIAPHDDRAFGAVYIALARAGFIEKCGSCIRRKGHGTAGGNVWRIRL